MCQKPIHDSCNNSYTDRGSEHIELIPMIRPRQNKSAATMRKRACIEIVEKSLYQQ